MRDVQQVHCTCTVQVRYAEKDGRRRRDSRAGLSCAAFRKIHRRRKGDIDMDLD